VTRGAKPFNAAQQALFGDVRRVGAALGQEIAWKPSGGVCEGTNLFAVVRNRVEVRWIENQTGVSPRTRHRLHVEYALHGAGPLTSVFLENESIFEYDGFRLSENRLVPLGLGFRLGDHANLRLYYTWRPLHLKSGWQDNHFIASQLVWKF
jgi:hypothetical protein